MFSRVCVCVCGGVLVEKTGAELTTGSKQRAHRRPIFSFFYSVPLPLLLGLARQEEEQRREDPLLAARHQAVRRALEHRRDLEAALGRDADRLERADEAVGDLAAELGGAEVAQAPAVGVDGVPPRDVGLWDRCVLLFRVLEKGVCVGCDCLCWVLGRFCVLGGSKAQPQKQQSQPPPQPLTTTTTTTTITKPATTPSL